MSRSVVLGNELGLHVKEVEQPDGHESHQGGGHCRQGPADEHAGEDTQDECEHGVADGTMSRWSNVVKMVMCTRSSGLATMSPSG